MALGLWAQNFSISAYFLSWTIPMVFYEAYMVQKMQQTQKCGLDLSLIQTGLDCFWAQEADAS